MCLNFLMSKAGNIALTFSNLKKKASVCDPIDGSPPDSPVPGILQARTLEWVAISFSNAWKWKVNVKSLSHVRLFTTPWTAAYQAPPSMGFSRQEDWSGGPSPSPQLTWKRLKAITATHFWLVYPRPQRAYINTIYTLKSSYERVTASIIILIHLKMSQYHIFFIHSSVDGHSGGFHVLAIVNSAQS